VFLLETTGASDFGPLLEAAAADLASWLAARSAEVTTHWLTVH
jgi:hypothetical protein